MSARSQQWHSEQPETSLHPLARYYCPTHGDRLVELRRESSVSVRVYGCPFKGCNNRHWEPR